jgi:hypothetical protein
MSSLQVATTGTISGIANQEQINAVSLNLATMSQSTTAPTPTSTGLASTAGLWWHDISDGTVRVRNQADTAWITIGTINETTGTFSPSGSSGTSLPLSGGTLTGALTVETGGVDIVAGGLTVGTGGALITGNSAITGALGISDILVVSRAATFESTLSAVGISSSGQIVNTSGGYKFPDGSVQTTAVSVSGLLTSASLSGFAPLSSPGFTGVPTAPTASSMATGNQVATLDWVLGRIIAAISAFSSTGTVSSGGGGPGA